MRSDYDGATCHCGSAWFVLAAVDGTPGQLTFDQRGAPTGYCGTVTCAECDTPYVPPRERLRIVGGAG